VCFLGVQEAAGEHRVDIVCEMLADKNLKNDISLLARKGRIMVGLCRFFVVDTDVVLFISFFLALSRPNTAGVRPSIHTSVNPQKVFFDSNFFQFSFVFTFS